MAAGNARVDDAIVGVVGSGRAAVGVLGSSACVDGVVLVSVVGRACAVLQSLQGRVIV